MDRQDPKRNAGCESTIAELRELPPDVRLRRAFSITAASLMIATLYDDAEHEPGVVAVLRDWARANKLVVEDLPVPGGGPDWNALAVVRIRTDFSSRIEVYYRNSAATL